MLGGMTDAVALCPAIGDKSDVAWIDRAIAWLAGRQHGVVAVWQLFGLGIGRHAIYHRVERGRLHAVHRGVFAVGHRVLSADGRRMAAVLAGGERAVASHGTAAELLGLRGFSGARFEVTIPGRRHARRAFESDRVKDRRLSVAGWRPVRVTWRQLESEPAPLARDLRALLAAA
jgi:hypothetical protein